MLDLLGQILCWIRQIGAMVLDALVDVGNLVIAGLAAFVQGLINLSPIPMPDVPELGGPFATAAGWVAWVFPVNTAVQILAFLVIAWLAWTVVAMGLRWAKYAE